MKINSSYGITGLHKSPAILLSMVFSILSMSRPELSALEERLLPWFENSFPRTSTVLRKRSSGIPGPNAADLMKIARNWRFLSPAFRKTYLEALEIPAGFRMYRSPGFGIEIHFATRGDDAVDTADRYGPEVNEWRILTGDPNGVPDYVDQAAFALDSAWSMEIVRFGFPRPFPYITGEFSSDNYRVVIREMSFDYYGLTSPVGSDTDSDDGFPSIITIRNSWEGWDINEVIEYESHPEKGIRITCVHEFFHAIQYRMSRQVREDVYLDDFPLSWVEGTACMMEELGFPEVNDYSQYAVDYFENPSRFSVFGTAHDQTIYSNVLACLFLYRALAPEPRGIEWFRGIFVGNMEKPSPFTHLLDEASRGQGRTWTDILNEFHTASFYSGARSSKNRFISDAAVLPEWSYTRGGIPPGEPVELTVKPSSMRCISFVNNGNESTGILRVSCIAHNDPGPGAFAVRVVLRDGEDADRDSTIVLLPSSPDTTSAVAGNWTLWEEAVAVVTCGIRDGDLRLTLRFDPVATPADFPRPPRPAAVDRKRPCSFGLDGRIIFRPPAPSGIRVITGKNSPARRMMNIR